MTDGPRILICDDEPGIRKTLSQILDDEGYTVDAVGLGQDALARAFGDEGQRPEAIFLDVWLPDLDGLTVLDRLRAAGLSMPVVMISGHGTVDTAVQAVKRGADDFLEKPLSLERVLLTLDKALERYHLARERDDLRRELMSRTDDAAKETLLGTSPAMMRLLDEIRRAGASEARVLIMGVSGVGKELFGHVKGSFTGAIDDRKGKWEQADGGTLFLDEIGDMSPRTQAKILRAIQDGRITRVGGTKTLATDVRIVAATNRDLPAMIRAGTFREDLYFRLAVVPLRVPPLSERPEDIPLLVAHFAQSLARRRGRRTKAFEPEAVEVLAKRRWPGNVRELQNLVERVLLMSSGPVVRAADLPPEDGPAAGRGPSRPASDEVPAHATLAEAREAFEKHYLSRVLAETKGNVSRAAERLGLDRTTLHRKMKALGLDGD